MIALAWLLRPFHGLPGGASQGASTLSKIMTGRDMHRIRCKMGSPIVEFGVVALGSRGVMNTVSKFVRRLEQQDELDDKTADKVRAYYAAWRETSMLTEDERDRKMLALWDQGNDTVEIARQLGMTEADVCRPLLRLMHERRAAKLADVSAAATALQGTATPDKASS